MVGPVTRRSEILLYYLGYNPRKLVQNGPRDASTTLNEVLHNALLFHLASYVQKRVLSIGLLSARRMVNVDAPLFDEILDQVQVARYAGREDQRRVVERVQVGPKFREVLEDG